MYISQRKYAEKFVSSFEMEWCKLPQSHQYADLPQLSYLSCTEEKKKKQKKKRNFILYVNQLFTNQGDPDSGSFTSTKDRKKVFITFCLVTSFEAFLAVETSTQSYLQLYKTI